MKIVSILLFLIMVLLEGCSSSKDIINEKNMQVINATFRNWREAPADGAVLPEVGTDLTIKLRNWPDDYVPRYIVYDKKKSFQAEITDSTKNEVIIRGTIIRTSGLLNTTSKPADVSDRLVYTDSDGKIRFVEIEDWESIED